MKKKKEPDFFLGTSGWSYDHWKERFYPEDLKPAEFLKYYAARFSTVEINNSFYRLPTKPALESWYEAVPAGFRFSVKASRYTTHVKRLKEPRQNANLFFKAVEKLEDKCGPLLFQLPPNFGMDLDRLKRFLKAAPKEFKYTFEFRHPSWYADETFDLLSKHNVALCLSDLRQVMPPLIDTAEFVYIRLHGPGEEAYRGSYGDQALLFWRKKLDGWKKKKKKVYCYFDNDQKAYAVTDCLRLKSMIKS